MLTMKVRSLNGRVILKRCCLPLVLTMAIIFYTSWRIVTDNKNDGSLRMVADHYFASPELTQDKSKKVILLSYMKAGTTFVGSVFEKNPDIFYVFEPEWSLFYQTVNEYSPMKYVDGTARDPIWFDKADRVAEEIVKNYLTCNISGVNKQSLQSRFHSESQYTRLLYECVRKIKANLTECVEDISRVCVSKHIRFAKTVRLRMEVAKEMLESDPNLRVIHIIRDPRGIVVSRLSWKEFYAVKASFTMGRVCAEILRDIEIVETMDMGLRKRVLPVMYEDVAERPEVMLQSLYSFLEIPLPENIKSYLRNVTRAKADDRTGFNLGRANSAKTAHDWRVKINWNLCREVDQICERVYEKLGLVPAKSEKDLKNQSISLRHHETSKTYTYKFRSTV